MANLDQLFHDAIIRTNLEFFLQRCLMTVNPGAPYLPNWHISAIVYQLERIRRGEIKRLIINMPPRHLKSLTVSVAFTAYLLGLEPDRRILALSYGNELSAKHASDFRSIVESHWYRRGFPQMQILRSVGDEVSTTRGGFRKTTSVFGPLTGLGGSCFVIDDPQKPIDAQSETLRNNLNGWFSNTLVSRLDNKETGAIIVVMQRVHLNDLSGYLLETSNDWTLLSLPAIVEHDETVLIGEGRTHLRRAGQALHPALESLATLQKLQREVGADVFAAQYQQSPVPPGGAMIRRSWLRYYDRLPDCGTRGIIIQSWDTGSKEGPQNDWSVCTTWLLFDKHYYLIDLTRGRYEYPRLKALALALAQKYKPRHILVEDASIGTALGQELKSIHFGGAVRLIRPERDKATRLYINQAKFETGMVLFPKGARFLPDLEPELLSFPQSKNDDQVDSITQALSYELSGYTLDNVR